MKFSQINKKVLKTKFINLRLSTNPLFSPRFVVSYGKKKVSTYFKRNIDFLRGINCYRGFRHKKNLPVRGQRTHTNGKTRKKSLQKKIS